MDMIKTSFVLEAGDAGKCRVELSNDPLHKYSYRPIGYQFILKNVAIQTGLYTRGKHAGVFAAWWSITGSYDLPKKDFQGTATIPYYKTKKVQGALIVAYKATTKDIQITNVKHIFIDAD